MTDYNIFRVGLAKEQLRDEFAEGLAQDTIQAPPYFMGDTRGRQVLAFALADLVQGSGLDLNSKPNVLAGLIEFALEMGEKAVPTRQENL